MRRTSDFTTIELCYICKFFDHDGASRVGMALNRSSKSIVEVVRTLRKNGKFESYRKLWDTLFEKGVGA